MAQHTQFSIDTGVDVYFCDPKSPGSEVPMGTPTGSSVNNFPKSTNMSQLTRENLDDSAHSFNGRPRQTLDWMTPSEKLTGVAMTP